MSNPTTPTYNASNLGEPETWPITNQEQAEAYIAAVAARTHESTRTIAEHSVEYLLKNLNDDALRVYANQLEDQANGIKRQLASVEALLERADTEIDRRENAFEDARKELKTKHSIS